MRNHSPGGTERTPGSAGQATISQDTAGRGPGNAPPIQLCGDRGRPPALHRNAAGGPSDGQSSMCAGTLPPLAAIPFITCLCSQMFMLALSFMSPV